MHSILSVTDPLCSQWPCGVFNISKNAPLIKNPLGNSLRPFFVNEQNWHRCKACWPFDCFLCMNWNLILVKITFFKKWLIPWRAFVSLLYDNSLMAFICTSWLGRHTTSLSDIPLRGFFSDFRFFLRTISTPCCIFFLFNMQSPIGFTVQGSFG